MSKYNKRLFWSAVVIIPLLWAVNTWRDAAWTADQSAQAALDKEISDQLAAIPPAQSYPDSLSELDLTYPDGGDSSLLSRFEYYSNGQSCSVRTELWGKEVVRIFPATE